MHLNDDKTLEKPVYGTSDLPFNYWKIRHLRWKGDKEAIRYLATHDPAYLDLLRQFLPEGDRERKFRLYVQWVGRATAPAGGLWQEGATAMTLNAEGVQPDTIAAGLNFWKEMIGETT